MSNTPKKTQMTPPMTKVACHTGFMEGRYAPKMSVRGLSAARGYLWGVPLPAWLTQAGLPLEVYTRPTLISRNGPTTRTFVRYRLPLLWSVMGPGLPVQLAGCTLMTQECNRAQCVIEDTVCFITVPNHWKQQELLQRPPTRVLHI